MTDFSSFSFVLLTGAPSQGWLALTAAFAHSPTAGAESYSAADAAIRRVGLTCRTAIEGRRAARALADWARRFALTEPGLQVLWCLRTALHEGLDQTTIATQLACSAAQVSNTIEHLRERGWIVQRAVPGDRRRNVWLLATEGATLLQQMLAATGYLPSVDSATQCEGLVNDRVQEAAA